MIRFLFLLPAIFLCHLAQAQPVYKCTANGKVSYGDHPCVHGVSRQLPPPAPGVDPPGKNAVATGDARALLEIEKLRIQQEKERAAQEKTASAERREQQKLAREAGVRRKTCERLRLHARWAREDAARAHGERREAARLKARRQAEALAVECPA